MINVLYAVSYGLICLLAYALVRGSVRLIRAIRARQMREAKFLAVAFLRVSLLLAGLMIIVVTHAQAIKVAQILILIMIAIGLPNDIRRLRSH